MNILKMYRTILTKMGVKVKKSQDEAARKTLLEESIEAGKLPESLEAEEIKFLGTLGYEVKDPGEVKADEDKSKGKKADKGDKAPKLTKAERKAARKAERIAARKAENSSPPIKAGKKLAIFGTHKGKTFHAHLVNGETVVDKKGKELGTPSMAARVHTGWAVNGWKFWKFEGKGGKNQFIGTLRAESDILKKPRTGKSKETKAKGKKITIKKSKKIKAKAGK